MERGIKLSKINATFKQAFDLTPLLGKLQQLGADLCEIIDKKSRDGKLGFLGGGNDALREKLTEIDVSKSIEGYDF